MGQNDNELEKEKIDGVEEAWLEVTLRKCGDDNRVEKVLGVKSEPALAKGENYSSRIDRVTVRLLLPTGRIDSRSFIVKRQIPVKDPSFQRDMTVYFSREYKTYKHILPCIQNLLKEHGDPDNKLWPTCVGLFQNKAIFFKDLKSKGFRLPSQRKTGMDLEHAVLALRALGKFHAASLVALELGLIDSGTLTTYPLFRDDSKMNGFLKGGVGLMADVVKEEWPPELKKYGDKLKEFEERVLELFRKEGVLSDGRMNVINHGDFWVNNMMFKYSHSETPIDIRFVDFQITHVNSYGVDLCYFFNTSMEPDLRNSNLEELLGHYTQSFSQTLQLLGSTRTAPTVQQVKDEMKRLAFYSLTMLSATRPLIMCDSEDKVISLDGILKPQENSDLRKRRLLTDPVFTRIAQVDIPRLFHQLHDE